MDLSPSELLADFRQPTHIAFHECGLGCSQFAEGSICCGELADRSWREFLLSDAAQKRVLLFVDPEENDL